MVCSLLSFAIIKDMQNVACSCCKISRLQWGLQLVREGATLTRWWQQQGSELQSQGHTHAGVGVR